MRESFLHYAWQYQYFDKEGLSTTKGERLSIQSPGFLNTDAGPDFSQCKLNIGGLEWRGSVEIHVNASDWNLHEHTNNKSYNNVVLHVVWNDDQEVLRSDGSSIPVLELKSRINLELLNNYENFFQNATHNIPCSQSFNTVPDILKYEMLDRVVMERLVVKSSDTLNRLTSNKGDWEQTSYQLLAQSLGLKVNAPTFVRLAELLPYRLIKRHHTNLQELEALLFGVGGFLEQELNDSYFNRLKENYAFLKHKYNIGNQLDVSEWKFLRLRPANFPTLRIAQFASLLHGKSNLFDILIHSSEINDINHWLGVTPSEYWADHYKFGKKVQSANKVIGKSTKDIIIINAVVPVMAAYSKHINEQKHIDRAISLLESIASENNKIVKLYKSLGFKAASALDSQGLIHLYSNYCSQNQCLKCSIGNFLIKPR